MIFFDLDDTLLDEHAAVREGARLLWDLGPAGADGSYDAFLDRWWALCDATFNRYMSGAISGPERFRERMRGLWPGIDDAEADARYARYQAAVEAAWRPFDDVAWCLKAVDEAPLGLITNGEEAQQRRKLERLGLAKRFETVVISGTLGFAKPDPRIFHEACRRAGEHPSACVHVGDNLERDARGAKAAGLRGVWLARDPAVPPAPDVTTIRSLTEMRSLVWG